MINLTLNELTPAQLRGIADVLDGAATIKVTVENANTSKALTTEEQIDRSQEAANNGVDKVEEFNIHWRSLPCRADSAPYEIGDDEYNRRLQEWLESGSKWCPTDDSDQPPKVIDIPKPPAAADTANSAEVPAPSANTVKLAKGQNGLMIPWDARIHGSAKKTNADGTWKFIKSVDKEVLVPQVEAELVAALAAMPAPDVTTTAPDAGSLFAESDAQHAGAVPTPGNPVPAAPVETVPTPPPAAKADPNTFQELLPLVTAAKNAGTLTQAKIDEVAQELGLAKFGLIATSQDPAIFGRAAQLLGV